MYVACSSRPTPAVPYVTFCPAASASFGNDLFTDPWLADTGALYNAPIGMIAATSSGPATWTLTFPPAPGFPNGLPQPISSVVFINRLGGFNARINTTSPGTLNLIAANGTVLSTRSIPSMSVSVWNFPNMAQQGPIFPNNTLSTAPAATFQASYTNQNTFVRYINITAAAGKCLYFRELYVLDSTYTNVALYKPTIQSNTSFNGGYFDPSFGGFTSFSSYGTDGIIDMDGPAGNMVNLGCSGNAWWQVDLGGVYNISRIVFFNRE